MTGRAEPGGQPATAAMGDPNAMPSHGEMPSATDVSDARAALVIKSIIREIVLACAEQGHEVSEDLSAFMVKSIVLDPLSGFKSNNEMTKEDIGGLVEKCVEMLTDEDNISISTIRMQVHFGQNYTSADESARQLQANTAAKVRNLEADVIESTAGSRDECELLYRKIVSLVLLQSGLGSSTDITVVRETTAALESVLPPVELGTFAALTRRQKAKQLKELALIITGIRLFNKSCGKGGQSIPDFSLESSELCQHLLTTMRGNLKRFSELATLYSSVLYSTPDDFVWIAPLMNARQYTTYVTLLQRDVAELASKVGKLTSRLHERLSHLKGIVQSKAAVPTDQVYPHFMEIAEISELLQELNHFLVKVKDLVDALLPFTMNQSRFASQQEAVFNAVQIPLHIQQVHDAGVNESNLITFTALKNMGFEDTAPAPIMPSIDNKVDADIINQVAAVQGAHGGLELLTPDTTHGYEWVALHNGGFCAYSSSKPVPAILPVDRSYGILKYNGRLYGFSDARSMQAFLAEVDQVLTETVENGKRFPELIELLQLHEFFASDVQRGSQFGGGQRDAAVMSNCSVQTDTHPMESNMVKDYEWNEWALRKKAIHLANLRQKKTHSVQTDRSNYRRETSTQVYLPKKAGTQTRRDASTSVPKPVTYIKGLRGPRGSKATKVEVVDLTVGIGGIQLDVRGLCGGASK